MNTIEAMKNEKIPFIICIRYSKRYLQIVVFRFIFWALFDDLLQKQCVFSHSLNGFQ
jgi:hypothetical protein